MNRAIQINLSAALWDPANQSAARELEEQHVNARAVCAKTNGTGMQKTGGWCYEVARKMSGRHRSGGMVTLRHNESYKLPLHHYEADMGVARVLLALLDGSLPFMRSTQTIIDFGAGLSGERLGAGNNSNSIRKSSI